MHMRAGMCTDICVSVDGNVDVRVQMYTHVMGSFSRLKGGPLLFFYGSTLLSRTRRSTPTKNAMASGRLQKL